MPLRFAKPSPPSGWLGDLHPRAIEHARHATNPLRGSRLIETTFYDFTGRVADSARPLA
jgi:hypothetical protein